jgi:hypothetical protein
MTTPVDPPDPGLPPAPPIAPGAAPPASLLAAVKLMYVGAGLSLLAMFFAPRHPQSVARSVGRGRPSVVIGLIAVGLWLWKAQANHRGEAWARIVATVLFALNIGVTAYNLAQTTGFGAVINITSIVLSGAILWLLYRQDTNAYYAARSGQTGR